MEDIKQKLNEVLNANPELVEKVKNAPAEAVEAIKKATGLSLDSTDVDKIKDAYREFTGDDGLDLGDFQRAAAALFEKGKQAAANIDMDSIKETAGQVVEKGTELAGKAVEKGAELAGDLVEKGKDLVENVAKNDDGVDTPSDSE